MSVPFRFFNILPPSYTYYFVCVQTVVRELSSSHFYSRDFSVSDPFDLEFYYRIAIQIINRLVSETTS